MSILDSVWQWIQHPSRPIYRRLRTTHGPVRSKRLLPTLSCKWVTIIIVILLISVATLLDVQLSVRIYLRNWISHAEDAFNEPLHGCFDGYPVDSRYFLGASEYMYDITPGVSLLDDYDCYDYASTIQPIPSRQPPKEKNIYHAYWRADLNEVGPKQLATLRSFFATQNTSTSLLYLWSNGDLSVSPVIQQIKAHVGDIMELRIYNRTELSQGTPMENSRFLNQEDDDGYLDGDLARILVIYKYGGMWFDMDSLFIRDMSPLFDHEWLSQWDCFEPKGYPFNGAFMRFDKQSPYLCEILADMANGPTPRKGTIDWGAYTYYRVYRKLLNSVIKPWDVLPWCFTDSSTCAPANSMPSAFDETEFPRNRLLQTFAYHWHNQWRKAPGTLFRFLENIHIDALGW